MANSRFRPPMSDRQEPRTAAVLLDGGLDLKTNPFLVGNGKTTQADNVWHVTPGQVRQLPASDTGNAFGGRSTNGIYNLATRATVQPAGNGDVLVHGEDGFGTASIFSANASQTGGNLGSTSGPVTVPLAPWNVRIKNYNGSINNAQAGGSTSTPNYTGLVVTTPFDGTAQTNMPVWCVWGDGGEIYVSLGDYNSDTVLANPTTVLNGNGFLNLNNFVAKALPGTNKVFIAANIYTPASNIYTLNWYVFGPPSGSKGPVQVATGQIAQGTGTAGPPAGTGYLDIAQYAGRVFLTWANAGTTKLREFDQTGPLGVTLNMPSGSGGYTSLSSTSQNLGTAGQHFLIAAYVGATTSTLVVTLYDASLNAINSLPTVLPQPLVSYTLGVAYNILASGAPRIKITIAYILPETIAAYGTAPAFTTNTTAFCTVSYSPSFNNLNAATFRYFRCAQGSRPLSKGFSTSLIGVAGPQANGQVYFAVATQPVDPNQNANANYCAAGFSPNVTTYGYPTYYIVDDNANIVGRWAEGAGEPGGVNPNNYYAVPNYIIGTGDASSLSVVLPHFRWTAQGITPSGDPAGIIYYISLYSLSYQKQNTNAPPQFIAKSNFFSGGLTVAYDGKQIHEAGFHEPPHNLVLGTPNLVPGNPSYPFVQTTTNTVGGVTGSTQAFYQWVAIYTWVDAQGVVHRSAPSFPVQFAPVSNITASVRLLVPVPTATYKASNDGTVAALEGVTVALYRTVAIGSTYYLVSQQKCTAVNQAALTVGPADHYVIFLDNTPDSTLAKNAQLYTQDGSWITAAPPGFLWQTLFQGQLFGLAVVDNQSRLYWSANPLQQAVQTSAVNVAPEFNTTSYIPVPTEIGDVRSCEVIDTNIYVFGTRGIALTNGSGPGRLLPQGQTALIPGQGYNPMSLIRTPAGVVGTGSPVALPQGIMYQDRQGMMLLDRAQQTEFAGSAIDTLTGYGVPGTGGIQLNVYGNATLLSELQAVVWCNPTGPALVFDYNQSKWSTWSNFTNSHKLVARPDGTFYGSLQKYTGPQLLASSQVCPFTSFQPSLTNQAVNLPLVVETGWDLTGLGFAAEGVYIEGMLLGQSFGNGGTLTIETAVNYGTYAPAATFQMPPAGPFQFRIRPTTSLRAWSVRYRVKVYPAYNTAVPPQVMGAEVARLTGFMVFSGLDTAGVTRVGQSNSR
jgi:hypothetical protein